LAITIEEKEDVSSNWVNLSKKGDAGIWNM